MVDSWHWRFSLTQPCRSCLKVLTCRPQSLYRTMADVNLSDDVLVLLVSDIHCGLRLMLLKVLSTRRLDVGCSIDGMS